ncbi:245_t:CDS:2 [Entrophospora sp. SA101]|nr:15881_t:CDS:2 [Entrophospora sp. SA101]CAJ0760668.1 245_t:CDS:2 [Entrophospora sp. SA101]
MLDTKNVNEGLTTACLGIPPTISEAIDIIKNSDEGDEIERTYITTACSRCKKRMLNGQEKSPKKIANNGVEKKTRKPRIKRLNKFNDVMKDLLNHEGVGVDGNNNNNNRLTPSSSFQSTLPTPSYSFTFSHDTYDINNNNTVIRSSNLTDSPIQAPFSFFDIPNRYNVHQIQIQIPPENISDFVLGPNALTTNVDLDIVNDNYGGEVDPILFHHLLMHGSLDSFNSSTPINKQYVDYLKTVSISNANIANVGNYQLDASPIDVSQVGKPFIGEQGPPYYNHHHQQ